MNENVLYQLCITSGRIVLFHPTNSSLSQRLINYGHDSVSNYDLIANQSTSQRGGTWPADPPSAPHPHTPGAAVSVISRFFSLGRGSWESFQAWNWCPSEDGASIWDRCSHLEYPHRRGGINQTGPSPGWRSGTGLG